MFSFKPLSHKFKCACMGVSLGLAAVILYVTFALAHQMTGSDQMVLVPVQPEASVQGVK